MEDKAVSFNEFDDKAFYNALIEKGYMNSEERCLEFFDVAMIHCEIKPISYMRLRGVAVSEYRMILSDDYVSRRDATFKTLENAFELLHERIHRQKSNQHNM